MAYKKKRRQSLQFESSQVSWLLRHQHTHVRAHTHTQQHSSETIAEKSYNILFIIPEYNLKSPDILKGSKTWSILKRKKTTSQYSEMTQILWLAKISK